MNARLIMQVLLCLSWILIVWLVVGDVEKDGVKPKAKKVDCTYSIQYSRGLVTYLGKGMVLE